MDVNFRAHPAPVVANAQEQNQKCNNQRPRFDDIRAMFVEEKATAAPLAAESVASDDADPVCPICQHDLHQPGHGGLQGAEEVLLPGCRHGFHRACLQALVDHAHDSHQLNYHHSGLLPCPLCRAPFDAEPFDAFAEARRALSDPLQCRRAGVTRGGQWQRTTFMSEDHLVENLASQQPRAVPRTRNTLDKVQPQL